VHIRSLPRSRPSRNRRRNGRWIRCAILDRKWVAPNAAIGLYLLNDQRREVERASDGRGRPIEFNPHTSECELERVINALGDGLYRLVARDPAGRILARRDFAAAMWSVPDVHQRGHAPRTEIEELKAQLSEARKATEEAATERDAARLEAEASKQAVAERDAEIDALEAALEGKDQQLRRARRLYARLSARDEPKSGGTLDRQDLGEREPAGEQNGSETPTRKRDYRLRGRRSPRPERPPKTRSTDPERGNDPAAESSSELGLDNLERLLDMVSRHVKEWSGDPPARDEPEPGSDP